MLQPGDRLCESADLAERGPGLRFTFSWDGLSTPAFAIRYDGTVYAYLNRCAHKQVELDWQEGQFFDGDRRYLICATHGALYEPASGACTSGPCRGGRLTVIRIHEKDGAIWLGDQSASMLTTSRHEPA